MAEIKLTVVDDADRLAEALERIATALEKLVDVAVEGDGPDIWDGEYDED